MQDKYKTKEAEIVKQKDEAFKLKEDYFKKQQ